MFTRSDSCRMLFICWRCKHGDKESVARKSVSMNWFFEPLRHQINSADVHTPKYQWLGVASGRVICFVAGAFILLSFSFEPRRYPLTRRSSCAFNSRRKAIDFEDGVCYLFTVSANNSDYTRQENDYLRCPLCPHYPKLYSGLFLVGSCLSSRCPRTRSDPEPSAPRAAERRRIF